MARNPAGDDNLAGNPFIDQDGDVHLNGTTVYLENATIDSATGGAGVKVGAASTDLIGFYGATPVDQPAVTADLLDSLQEVGLIASGAGDTPLNLSAGALTAGAITATGNVNLGNATTDLVGFHGATPTDQCAAYTQTYATAARTHANPTATAHTYPGSGNMFDATPADLLINVRTDSTANAVADVVVNEKSLADNLNQLIADVANVKQVLNAALDDLQEKGLVG